MLGFCFSCIPCRLGLPTDVCCYFTDSFIFKLLFLDLFTVVFCIQEDFLKLVYKETILVGHSLENDLLALKISHDLVIDTAVLYKHPRGASYKTALRVLTRRFLSREIQESRNGHDSIEDARAAMELALLKIRHGKSFVLCILMVPFMSEMKLMEHPRSN